MKTTKLILLLVACVNSQVHCAAPSSQVMAVYDAAVAGDEDRVREVLCWQSKYGQKPIDITDQALSHAIMVNDSRATRVLTLLYHDLARSFWSRHYLIFTVVASMVGIGAGLGIGQRITGKYQED